MTRGKKSDQREEPDDGVARPGTDQGATAVKPGGKFEELTEMMMSFMQSQTARDKQEECRLRSMEQQFTRIQEQVSLIKEERRLRRQNGRLAEELDCINVWYGDQTQRKKKVMQLIKEYRMELREQDRQKQQKEAKHIMERQQLERRRQAELSAQKARKEEEKSKREELVKILEENNRQMKSELERAAAEKLEKVNSSLQRHLQRSTEEKEERQRELTGMKGQIATLMQVLQFRADPAQLERKLYSSERRLKQTQSDKIKLQLRVEELQHKYEAKGNQIPKREKEKLLFDITPPSEETMLHKGKQKHRAEWRPMEEAKILKTL
ncbi:inner centromere protein A-like [Gymnodraco acuticeps]|uniref:Inner centromere protein A-like n=1 Tax=Gymnodraco acuticeps TaxID=8218 RepID=A0A6P8U9R3_GYMAC|nr:inner centromere protein A-like [Gymnodraco acuticeps]